MFSGSFSQKPQSNILYEWVERLTHGVIEDAQLSTYRMPAFASSYETAAHSLMKPT